MNVERALEFRRGEVERARSVQGSYARVYGFSKVNGAGESLLIVNFPMSFQEMPSVSGGGSLDENEVVVPGQYPTWNVGVARWETKEIAGGLYWVGATLIFVVTGPVLQRSTIHWQFEGKALSNPIGGITDDHHHLDEPI